MAVSGVMAATAVAGAASSAYSSSKASSAQKKAAMRAAAAQDAVTKKNVELETGLYDKNTALAQDTYAQQQSDLAKGFTTANSTTNTGFDQAGGAVQQGYGGAIDTLSPFASSNALMQLYDMGGVARPGETTARPYSFQANDPSYDWRLKQGGQALDRSAASRGLLLSGAQIKGATDYGQGAASQEYGAQYNRLAGLASGAQSAAGQVAGYQQGEGSALANLATGRGSALSNLATGEGTALSNLGQTNLSNQTTLNTNFGNKIADINQSGVQGVNAQNQNAASARASGYLSTGQAINTGLQGLAGAYGGSAYGGGPGLYGGGMSPGGAATNYQPINWYQPTR